MKESGVNIKSPFTIPDDTLKEIQDFADFISPYETKNHAPLIVLQDKKSMSFYCECHITAKDLARYGDPDAVIDPEWQEEFRANRELEPDNFYFLQMVEDAKKGRTFSDIVIEFNKTYKESKPLKILGGQHRMEALKRALEERVNGTHGIKVYFNLSKDQRADIMRISNTNINVTSDLRDRIEEQRLEPPGMLRSFCHETGILKKGEDFGDKRRYEEEFSPTVRMVRSFIVNFFKGIEYKGDIDKDAVIPYLCKSGREVDAEYLKVFSRFKSRGRFDDPELITAAKRFANLHDVQFKNANSINGVARKEYKIKAYNLAVITSWAFASGVVNKDGTRLKKLYSLPDLCGKDDPLQAKAMAKAKHKTDTDTYRGLGTRNDSKERGRLLQLFLNYSNSKKPRITEQMCNAAIDIFHSNDDTIRAEKKRKRAF